MGRRVVGWQVAARFPELVRTWTAVSTPNQLALNEVLTVDTDQRARFAYMRTLREPEQAEATLLADNAARLRTLYGEVISSERVNEDVAFFQQPEVLKLALNWYRAMSPSDVDGLSLVKVPTSYVWGSADPAFGRTAARRSGDFVDAPYRFFPIEGASHWLPDEIPDTLTQMICHHTSGV